MQQPRAKQWSTTYAWRKRHRSANPRHNRATARAGAGAPSRRPQQQNSAHTNFAHCSWAPGGQDGCPAFALAYVGLFALSSRGEQEFHLSLGFQQWANSFRLWLIPITLKERVCFE
jgi:hypothetical protein